MFASKSVQDNPATTTVGSVQLGTKITGIWTMQKKDETMEIQNKRKDENQVNEKVQDMHTTIL